VQLQGSDGIPLQQVSPGVFRWSASIADPGDVALSALVTGIDGFTADPVSATSAVVPLTALEGPRLRAVARAPAAVDVGQVFEVTVDLVNDGDVDALGAQLAAPVTAGASPVGTPAGPQDVPASVTRTFRWSMQAGSAGQLDLSTSGTASDPLAGSTLPLAAGWDPVSVQSAPALSVAISAPPVASTGPRIAVRVGVTNAGDGTARG